MSSVLETEIDKEESVKFVDFDPEFQEKIVALQVRDSVFARRTEGLLKPNYFDSRADAAIVDMAIRYYEKYKHVPSESSVIVTLFKDEIKKGRIRKDMVEECRDKIKAIFSTDISARDYVIDQVGDFARHQAVQKAIFDAVDAIERHNMDKAEELITKAFQVGPHADSAPYDYWTEIDSRTKYRVDVKSGKIKPNGISTGIPALDKVLFHKGWGIKELSVLLAGAKRGKSFSLWDFGKLISLQGKNVLGVTLEVSKEVLSERLDASVADTEIDAISSHILDVRRAVSEKAESGRVGKYLLHEYPSGTFRPLDLENLIESYKAQGIKFDAVIIDYLDIMAPNKWTPNEIENSRTIWVDTRAIAQREELAILSATQTNREGHKSVTAKAEHAAEDFNKIRTADLVISINATEEEMAKGEARLFFAASRNQKGEFTMRIKRDLSRGHALTEVIGYE
ncbi:hypothetical protein J7963_19210 [Vibrio parahaemolyticus]|nr:hypothetical protein [Vibrio parahaemolyticus]